VTGDALRARLQRAFVAAVASVDLVALKVATEAQALCGGISAA